MPINARAPSPYGRSTGVHSDRHDRNVSHPGPNADAESHEFLIGLSISRLSLAAGRESLVEVQGVIYSLATFDSRAKGSKSRSHLVRGLGYRGSL
jgi:hypothetical protein